MNDREKDVIARDDHKFRLEVLTKLGAMEANHKDMCRRLDENHETHQAIFNRMDNIAGDIKKNSNDVSEIKGKASAWGAFMGALMGFLASLGIKSWT